MGKQSLLIDTNALSHLSQVSIELNGRTVDKWLWALFNLHTCKAIRDEFHVGSNKASASYRAINKRLRGNEKNQNEVQTIPRLRHTDALESKWLSPRYYTKALGATDRGERHLICAAAELASKRTIGRFAIVTDDNTAVRTFIRPILKDHPIAEVWSTLDLLLFLYLTRKEVSKAFVKEAIRDIGGASSFSIFEFRDLGESEAERRIELVKLYHRKVDRISELRNQLSTN